MARQKTTKKTSSKSSLKRGRGRPSKRFEQSKRVDARNGTKNFLVQLKLGESYMSLVLGALVVAGLALIFFLFLRNSDSLRQINIGNQTPQEQNIPTGLPTGIQDTQAPTQQPGSTTRGGERVHTLLEGESLWDVAVKFYGDGYRWTDISNANNLENPDFVNPGTKLKIPNPRIDPKQGTAPSAGKNYIVRQGDNLWTISAAVYGSGYSYAEVAKVNHISNPNRIYPGTRISMPKTVAQIGVGG